MKPMVLGMLAHVDAGKTTLSEAMLYTCGKIRKLGRVDHGTTFLDFDTQEKSRGITIFSKEARMCWKQSELMLLDTPGHVDFSAEMERTLSVLDVAIMVISGVDGVQVHSETIWRLLQHYQIPVMIFVNKMDISHQSEAALLQELQERFSAHCIKMHPSSTAWMEEVAMCSDALLEEYMSDGSISSRMIQQAVQHREVFPCFFGSALKLEGIDALLDGLDAWMPIHTYPTEFGAKIYKISHDETGNRLTHMKITGGSLQAKHLLENGEKVDQIRRYHGEKYEMVTQLDAGYVCACKGLQELQAGETLGFAKEHQKELLSSYLTYRMVLPAGSDPFAVMKQLRPLAQEDPSLHLSYDQTLKEIHLQVRGEVQIEILQKLILERYQLAVSFDEGRISYRETILQPVEGVGHYEPLRHYAEVHLLLEPLPQGRGIQYASNCPLDMLDAATQRMILSYLQGEDLIGVLTGSMLTDLRITLLGGKAHQKHTSGGDFREATRRALRQGLKQTKCQLLAPWDEFRLEIPNHCVSRVMFDLQQQDVTYHPPIEKGDKTIIQGQAPSAWMRTYAQELRTFSKGKGKLSKAMYGYQPVNHQEAICKEIGYDSERDLHHPTGSIFCIHGAGSYVKWDEVYAHMHVDFLYAQETTTTAYHAHRPHKIDEEELKRVTAQLHQPRKKWQNKQSSQPSEEPKNPLIKDNQRMQTCLLVDGYNMIFSWPNLKEMANENMDGARNRLLAMLGSYQGYRNLVLIVVFDAYKTDTVKEQVYKDHNVHVIYTKTSQSADSYIEKATRSLAKQYRVIVATSDAQEQNIILGQGASRMSAYELYQEVTTTHHKESRLDVHQPVFRHMALEKLRDLQDPEKKK